MTLHKKTLLAELTEIIVECTEKVEALRDLPLHRLNQRVAEGSWTALECLEHLNLYGDFYLPEVEKNILNANKSVVRPFYKPGFMGNYFAGLMKVTEGKVKKKMATPKDKNPLHSSLSLTTLDRFLKQQERWLKLLQVADSVDLGNVRTAISLTKLIKLKLGDTLRFCVYHIERHVLQAERTLAATGDRP